MEFQNYIQNYVNNLDLKKFKIKTPKINSCLINKYRTGNDYIRPHRDTALSFGLNPTIIGCSLGDTRDIVFKRVFNEQKKSIPKRDVGKKFLDFKFKLESGSIFIMAGSSQKYWTHEVPKCNSNISRYSLTFRETINN